jgi:hypothetical protein
VNVVALGTDGNVWQRAWDHYNFYGWFNWGNPGVGLDQGVGTAGFGDDRLDVSAGHDPQLYDRVWISGLRPWSSDAQSENQAYPVDMSTW